MPPTAPRTFGPFDVYERLGLGGMAVVHRARYRPEGDGAPDLALKRLLPHLAEQPEFVDSFARESQIACLLEHPNIVRSFGYGRVGEVPFLVMAYLPGHNLVDVLRRAALSPAPPPIAATLQLLLDLLCALEYAHDVVEDGGEPMRLIHRDISPSNLIVSHEGVLRVIDFGVAKAHSARLQTQSGRAKGKLSYMAPESQRGQLLDARCDLFSVGALAHELIRARPLFSGSQQLENFRRLSDGEIEPPSSGNPLCPPALDAAVMCALSADPDDRFSSAAEMRAALEAVTDSLYEPMDRAGVARWLARLLPADRSEPLVREHRPGSEAVENAIDSLLRPEDVLEFWPANQSLSGPTLVGRAPAEPKPPSTSQPTTVPVPRSLARTPRNLPLPPPPDTLLASGAGTRRNDSTPPLVTFRAPSEPGRRAGRTPRRGSWAVGTRTPPRTPPRGISAEQPPSRPPGATPPLAIGPTTRPTAGRRYLTIALVSTLAVATGLLAAIFFASGAEENAVLRVEVEPPEAEIAINGELEDRTSELAPGTHVISVSHTGYETTSITIEAERGESHHVHVLLRPTN